MDILHSKKIKKKNVYDHLKVQRTLLEKMKEQLFEWFKRNIFID